MSSAPTLFYGFPRSMPSLIGAAMHQLDRDLDMLAPHQESSARTRSPTYSYHVDNHEIRIQVELPGVSPADLVVHTEGDQISIKAPRYRRTTNKSTDKAIPTDTAQHNSDAASCDDANDTCNANEATPEIVFVKQFRAPNALDAGAVKASFRDGLLDLTLPIKSQKTVQRVLVSAWELPQQIESYYTPCPVLFSTIRLARFVSVLALVRLPTYQVRTDSTRNSLLCIRFL